MGLRDRVRQRVNGVVKDLVLRVVGGGPYDGDGVGERTDAWPPKTMGHVSAAPPPGDHPVDRAARGEWKEPDFAAGWGTASDEPVETVDVEVSTGSTLEPVTEKTFDRMPMGSVAQGEFFPGLDPVSLAQAEARAAVQKATPEPVAKPEPAEPAEPVDLEDPLDDEGRTAVQAAIVEALKEIYDPEIPVDIYELGLIYDVDVFADRHVEIRMTLTSPNCPAAQSLPGEVELKAAGVGGVRHALVDIVWDPPWSPERMSEEARLELNI